MKFQLSPPGTIGIIGGGQLGMMTIREAQRMGYRSVVWDPDPNCPASRLADVTIGASFDDQAAARSLASQVDVVTYEFENVDPDIVAWLEAEKTVRPRSAILRVAQHRKFEKEQIGSYGLPVVEYASAQSPQDLRRAVETVGLPVVVKTATSGYDGKGQAVIRSQSDVDGYLDSMNTTFPEIVVEKFIDLRCEISVIVLRTESGEVTTFPVSENEHRDNILFQTRVPARIEEATRARAVSLAHDLAERLELIGIMCVEMFVTSDSEVLINEIAPRPHNSGHYTLDACDQSQFEAFVRAVCGLGIPTPRLLTPSGMINILGKDLELVDVDHLSKEPGIKLHIYGKRRVEPKRKMGHITVLGDDEAEVDQKLSFVKAMLNVP